MVTNVQNFKGLDSFQQEDAADFSVGSDDPEVQWYASQPVQGKNAVPATGWYIPQGKYENLEAAIIAYNADHQDNPFRLATVMHEQSGKTSEDWIFPEELSFFVLCRGVKEPLVDKGIVSVYALKWNPKDGDDKESKFYVRAFVSELLEYGYDDPIQFRVKGKGRTRGFKSTLLDQQRVLAEFKKLYGIALPFWGFSLPIGASMTEVGNGQVSKKMYVPSSFIPGKITEEYLQEHYIGNHVLGDGLSEMLSAAFKETLEWAQETTKNLLKGKEEAPAYAKENGEAPNDSPIFGEDGQPLETTPKNTNTTEASEPAGTGQREALKKLGMKLQRPDLVTMADDPGLTKALAGSTILLAQKKQG